MSDHDSYVVKLVLVSLGTGRTNGTVGFVLPCVLATFAALGFLRWDSSWLDSCGVYSGGFCLVSWVFVVSVSLTLTPPHEGQSCPPNPAWAKKMPADFSIGLFFSQEVLGVGGLVLLRPFVGILVRDFCGFWLDSCGGFLFSNFWFRTPA
jgi:hypothetical protein